MPAKKSHTKKVIGKNTSVKKTAKPVAKSKPALKNTAKKVVKQTKSVKTAKNIKPAKPVKKAEKQSPKQVINKPVAVKAPVISKAPTPVVNNVKEITKQKSSTFDKGVKVVYPAHGVGEIIGVETHMIAGTELKQYVIQFEREKMVLRVPVARAEKSGLRMLSSDDELKDMRKTLLERPKSSRGMWSRRAKEYESKINSGNIISVAEVVRDLHKNVDDPERSYSERVIYENALERLAREVSAIKRLDIPGASDYLIKTINDNNPYFIKKAAAKKAAAEAEDESLAA